MKIRMYRLALLICILFCASCITTKSINHFATKNDLRLKKVSNINLFKGEIEIEEKNKDNSKKYVYLLYSGDSLLFISKDNRIVNNDFIYKIVNKTNSFTTLTRASWMPRYYTVDTLYIGGEFAYEKTYLYSSFPYTSNNIVQFYLREYQFINDSLRVNIYQSNSIISYSMNFETNTTKFKEENLSTHQIIYYPNQDKLSFFKKFIN